MAKKGLHKKCERCGEEYYEYPYLKDKTRFCSTVCANKGNANSNSRSKMGKNNPMYGKVPWNYKGGIADVNSKIRGSKLYKRWSRAVKKRDGCCIKCGSIDKLEADHYPITFAQIMDKYKIKNVEQSNNCKEMFNLKNGRTLCNDCHKKTKTYKVNLKYQLIKN